MKPNFTEEKKLRKLGFYFVVGLDEAGRGPLAGPVVAGAVLIKNKNLKIFKELNDSKKLSEKQREYFYEILINHKDVDWGVGIVSEKIIDKINILEATKMAMEKAIKKLNADLSHRVNKKSPQGYSSKGKKFDQKIIEALKDKDVKTILENFSLAEEVACDDLPGLILLLGLLDDVGLEAKLLSYEAPFGTGHAIVEYVQTFLPTPQQL